MGVPQEAAVLTGFASHVRRSVRWLDSLIEEIPQCRVEARRHIAAIPLVARLVDSVDAALVDDNGSHRSDKGQPPGWRGGREPRSKLSHAGSSRSWTPRPLQLGFQFSARPKISLLRSVLREHKCF